VLDMKDSYTHICHVNLNPQGVIHP
jgi:hypothetical protein